MEENVVDASGFGKFIIIIFQIVYKKDLLSKILIVCLL